MLDFPTLLRGGLSLDSPVRHKDHPLLKNASYILAIETSSSSKGSYSEVTGQCFVGGGLLIPGALGRVARSYQSLKILLKICHTHPTIYPHVLFS